MADPKSAFDGLDRAMHEKARLSILTCLLKRRDGLSFNDLKDSCDLTDGNLSRHLETLAEAGIVEITKGKNGRRPQTLAKLSPDGAKRFVDYLAVLEGIVANALESAEPAAAKSKVKFSTA